MATWQRCLPVLLLLVPLAAGACKSITEYAHKCHLGDNLNVHLNLSSEYWRHFFTYNSTTFVDYEVVGWKVSGSEEALTCGSSGSNNVNVTANCTLKITGITDSNSGFYYAHAQTKSYGNGTMSIMIALNVNGPIYADIFEEKYTDQLKVAGICTGSFLGALILLGLLLKFKYEDKEGKGYDMTMNETTYGANGTPET